MRASNNPDYVPALDGLRAIAIAGVVLYHADVPWMPGGFLGVEIFLVVSGYLITSLLRDEYRVRGTVDITDFWLRRARRLLPAMWALIFSVTMYVAYVLPDELATLRGDAIAALGYAANWVLIFDHKSYFEQAGRPALLKHFWSLAIEQQFYLFWPGVFSLIFARMPRLAAAALLICAAGESALWMSVLFNPDVDPSRLYFGTDTRASGLLLGAALAMLQPSRWLATWTADWRQGLELMGGLSLALLIAGCFLVGEFDPALYRGGFFWAGILTVLVVAAVLQPGSPLLRRVLSARPLCWLGLRSYSLYLWHFPVFMVTRPELDMPLSGAPAQLLRIGIALGCAELSYRFVEAPVRNGALLRVWATLQQYPAALRWALPATWVMVIGALCIEVASAGARTPPAEASAVWLARPGAAEGELSASVQEVATDEDRPPAVVASAAQPSASLPAAHSVSPPAADSGGPAAATRADAQGNVTQVLAVGDSVMLGAARHLRGSGVEVTIDAAVGRQASAVVQLLEQARRAGALPQVVLIHIGNNGTLRDQQFDKMMSVLADVPEVIFVNTKVPRRWQDPNNAVLMDGVRRHARARLIDWLAYSQGHPEWFRHDGYHLQPEGQRAYAELLRPYYRERQPGAEPRVLSAPAAM